MRKTPAIVIGPLALLLVLTACGSGGTPSAAAAVPSATDGSAPPGVTAHGIGQVDGAPDVITINVGVQTTAPHAGDALAANAAKAAAVIASLKAHGAADADVQTSQLSLYPQYDNNGNTIRGYNVTDTVTAKLHDVSKAGGAIDAAVGVAGDAGRLQGVSFSFDDDSSLLAQARAKAVAAAKTQAQQLADAAGSKLGSLRSLSEDTSPIGLPSLQGLSAAGAAAATPIQAGTDQVTVQVIAVWNLG